MGTVWSILLILILASPLWAKNPKDELKGVRQEIKAKKQLITKTKKVETVVSSELQAINRNLEQKQADLGRLDSELRGVESSLTRTGREIAQVTGEANRKRQEIDRRLAALYKAGEIGALRMFFSSESFPQMAENIRYMGAILEHDKRIFAEYNQKIDELRQLKTVLERDAQRKERVKENIALKKREIEQEKNNKAAYLLKVRNDRMAHEKSLKQLQANASRLQNMLDRLERLSRQKHLAKADKSGKSGKTAKTLKKLKELPPVPDRGFASQKGRLAMPVRGRVIETYGKHKHPEFNSYTFSKGLSIAVPEGTEIRNIYGGTVIYADYFKGFGNMVIIDHGGGYFSLYAHAAKILRKVGSEVKKNEAVATVGATDSTKGAMLYFEIRHQGKPQDPAVWVR
ncbi:MAG TPA: peptidoglycan DD-metalloendopeptidase family protein [Deltaproteobacteria bacterium]|nr:peptidoglycan DD-metalloendopeptidase family protein [Deltaproteobacteria bacterium]